MSQGSLSPRLSWPGLEVGATHSRHGTAQTNPTCLCKGPGPSKGGFLGRLAGTHVITPPFPKFPFNIPPTPTIFKNNNNKAQLGEPGIVSWELITELMGFALRNPDCTPQATGCSQRCCVAQPKGDGLPAVA